MNKSNNIWVVSLKVMLMSVFATIISFMLTTLIVNLASHMFFKGDAVGVRIFIQVIGLLVEFMFIYGTLWDCGYNDQNKINLGIAKGYSMYRGILIGFISAIPYYAMSFAMMLMAFDKIRDLTGLFRVLSSQFWGIYTFLLPVLTSSNEGSLAIAETCATPAQAIAAVFVPTFIPILSYVPYMMGRKGIAVGEKMLYKMNSNKRD